MHFHSIHFSQCVKPATQTKRFKFNKLFANIILKYFVGKTENEFRYSAFCKEGRILECRVHIYAC